MRRTLAVLLNCSLAFAAGGCATKTTTTQQTNTTTQTATTQTAAQQPATAPSSDAATQPVAAPDTSAQNGAQPQTPSTASAQASGAQGTTNGAKSDACALITKAEFETVQGDPLKEQKSSEVAQGAFSVSQCFYQANTFAKSVSLTVTRGNDPARDELKEFWREKFHRETGERGREEKGGDREKRERAGKEKERERGREREEDEGEGSAPTKMSGIGDEAFWVGNRALGALYVLKKNSFLRISIGGSDDQETKQRKARLLAQKAIGRL